KRLAQLNAPLIEAVNVPNHTLHEYGMFVKSDELAKRFRSQSLNNDHVRWPISLEDAMGCKPIGCAFRLHLLRRFAEGQGLCLRKDVGEQHRVMASKWVERFNERNEIT